jgi:hypothetical protein
MFHQVIYLSSDPCISQPDQVTNSRVHRNMQAFLLNPGIPVLNLFEDPITGILIAQKRIDFRSISALIKESIMPFNFSLVVKESILCTASLVDFYDHDFRL